jgi:hypothetical protein
MKKEPKISMTQTWANYYSHITRGLPVDETHSVLSEERATQEKTIARAEEHLKGVVLYYKQSALADPDPPGVSKKGSVSLSDDDSDTIAKKPSQNTPKPAEELSDREI